MESEQISGKIFEVTWNTFMKIIKCKLKIKRDEFYMHKKKILSIIKF